MRKQAFAGLVCLSLCSFIFAQESRRAPIIEVFGGYSLLHTQVEGPSRSNVNGWNVATNTNLSRWFGATADFSGYYFRATNTFNLPAPFPPSLTAHDSFNYHSFLFGPQVSYRHPRATIFVHSLFGTSHNSFSVESRTSGVLGGSTTANPFTVALGGGVDINVSRRFALRPVQADYLYFRNSGLAQNSFRYSGGIVFRFGRR